MTFRRLICALIALAFALPLLARADAAQDFFSAAQQDNSSTILTQLLRGFDPNTLNAKGETALLIAVRHGSFKAISALLADPQTNVEMRNQQDESPLMLAALKGYLDLAKQLIARDADVNKPGWAPLHYAATKGDIPMIELLLDNDAYIDAESPNGTTPLMMAAQYGTPSAVKALLDAGADPNLKNGLGLSAIDFANRVSRADVAEAIARQIKAKQPKGTW